MAQSLKTFVSWVNRLSHLTHQGFPGVLLASPYRKSVLHHVLWLTIISSLSSVLDLLVLAIMAMLLVGDSSSQSLSLVQRYGIPIVVLAYICRVYILRLSASLAKKLSIINSLSLYNLLTQSTIEDNRPNIHYLSLLAANVNSMCVDLFIPLVQAYILVIVIVVTLVAAGIVFGLSKLAAVLLLGCIFGAVAVSYKKKFHSHTVLIESLMRSRVSFVKMIADNYLLLRVEGLFPQVGERHFSPQETKLRDSQTELARLHLMPKTLIEYLIPASLISVYLFSRDSSAVLESVIISLRLAFPLQSFAAYASVVIAAKTYISALRRTYSYYNSVSFSSGKRQCLTFQAGQTSEFVVSVKDLSIDFGTQEIIRNITFDVSLGEHVCLVGASGSGKSTVVNTLLGINQRFSGDIRYSPHLYDEKTNDLTNIAFIPQQPSIFEDDFDSFMSSYGRHSLENLDELLKDLDLQQFSSSRRISLSDASPGQIQRLFLARAVLMSPKLLILDEATSGLDQQAERVFIRTLGDRFGDTAILSIAHRQSYISKCDRVITI